MRKLTLLMSLFVSIAAMGQAKYFKGNSTYSSDILYTWDGKKVYKGKSTYTSDILSTIDGGIPIPVLMTIL